MTSAPLRALRALLADGEPHEAIEFMEAAGGNDFMELLEIIERGADGLPRYRIVSLREGFKPSRFFVGEEIPTPQEN